MKLRNKKTGGLANLVGDDFFRVRTDAGWADYNSLAELNEEWEDVPDEEWRDVLGFEELYQVSNLGNVRTVKRGEATVMSQEEHRNGYLSVHLRYKGVERRASVHRLVAEAFIPNPDGLRDVNHKNGVKTDNRVENLEWLSHSDNIKHAYQMKKPAEPLIKDEKIREAVRAWAVYNGVREVFYFTDGEGGSRLDAHTVTMGFYNELRELKEWEKYTIAELCGGEEE